jgi:hypothetical protein
MSQLGPAWPWPFSWQSDSGAQNPQGFGTRGASLTTSSLDVSFIRNVRLQWMLYVESYLSICRPTCQSMPCNFWCVGSTTSYCLGKGSTVDHITSVICMCTLCRLRTTSVFMWHNGHMFSWHACTDDSGDLNKFRSINQDAQPAMVIGQLTLSQYQFKSRAT